MVRYGALVLSFGILLLASCASSERQTIVPSSPGLVPGSVFKDCRDCPEMVVVPAGSFEMGSNERREERPIHSVSIERPVAVGRFEVTFDEWEACLADDGCAQYRPDDEGWGRGRQPVINVSWRYAQSYVWWLKRKTGRKYRLLSEAEWEYVARAGTQTRFWWGDDAGSGNANCGECGSAWDGKRAAPVGAFRPNPFGLFDTAGNVWEWVDDCYPEVSRFNETSKHGYEGAPPDGTPVLKQAACHMRVLRGGGFRDRPWHIRSANRKYGAQGFLDRAVGFRVARDPD